MLWSFLVALSVCPWSIHHPSSSAYFSSTSALRSVPQPQNVSRLYLKYYCPSYTVPPPRPTSVRRPDDPCGGNPHHKRVPKGSKHIRSNTMEEIVDVVLFNTAVLASGTTHAPTDRTPSPTRCTSPVPPTSIPYCIPYRVLVSTCTEADKTAPMLKNQKSTPHLPLQHCIPFVR